MSENVRNSYDGLTGPDGKRVSAYKYGGFSRDDMQALIDAGYTRIITGKDDSPKFGPTKPDTIKRAGNIIILKNRVGSTSSGFSRDRIYELAVKAIDESVARWRSRFALTKFTNLRNHRSVTSELIRDGSPRNLYVVTIIHRP